jgi:diacylglycerol kinase family enzyme
MDFMRAAVIMNYSAGTVLNDRNGVAEDNLKEVFRHHNIDAEIFAFDGRLLRDKTKEAVENNFEVVIAAGGDGTISSVAGELVHKNIPLGVLPLGTLNHFAKDLNIPLDLRKAIEVISRKKTQKIDVAEVNGVYFINNSSIGLYPKIVKKRTEKIERLGGRKWVSMFAAAISVFKHYPLLKVTVDDKEKQIYSKTPFVFIGNNQYEMHLFNLGGRNNISEGKLSVYFPTSSGKLSLLKYAFLTLINRLNQEKNFKIISTEHVTLETEKKIIEVATDGEVLLLQTPLDYRIHPAALNVITEQR